MKKILEKAGKTHTLTREEILILLEDKENEAALFEAADKTREKFVKNEVHLRALIEFTNVCRKNCLYCGLRRDNNHISRYRLSDEEILDAAHNAAKLGLRTIVLQGGEDSFYTKEYLCLVIKKIKKLNVAITLSIGEKTTEEYKAYKDAGADRFLLRIETTDKNLYKKLHPDSEYENRLKCINNLKNLGFETGTGIMTGLPGQTPESIADDILFFKSINADMIGIGPFIPCENTPLADFPSKNFDLALRATAITRLLLPDINIPATTAMETLKKNGRIIALCSGANVVMPNFTPEKFALKYYIYPDKNRTDYRKIIEEIKSIKRSVSSDYGFRKNFKV